MAFITKFLVFEDAEGEIALTEESEDGKV
eukprot:COSAG02_NODE_37737_length_438_cov_0.758112_1_plen_28_part_10